MSDRTPPRRVAGLTCEPPTYPATLGETWDCPQCGRHYIASDPLSDESLPGWVRKHIPAGTFGWRSRQGGA